MHTHPSSPCVLLVEDEALISMVLEYRLLASGYRVLTAATLPSAMEMAENDSIDAAVLDVELQGDRSFPVADLLRRRGIPFVFSSSCDARELPQDLRNEPFMQKPYNTSVLLETLAGRLSH